MCGRYRRRSDKQRVAEAFQVRTSLDDLDFAPEDDIAPGSMQPVVHMNDDGHRDIQLMYWGFNFPHRFTFNARSEAVLQSGLWRSSFEQRRCIVPADAYFEWKRIRKTNNPRYEITVPHREPFGMAAIWAKWKNKAGDLLPTMSIITTEPNEAIARIHTRQPVILEPREYKEWLEPASRPPLHLLRIFAVDEMNVALTEAHSMQLPLNSEVEIN